MKSQNVEVMLSQGQGSWVMDLPWGKQQVGAVVGRQVECLGQVAELKGGTRLHFQWPDGARQELQLGNPLPLILNPPIAS